MPRALTITRDDFTAAHLREAATRSNDANATREMSAPALVLEGYIRGEAGKLCGMDRETLRDWILRDNAEGSAKSPILQQMFDTSWTKLSFQARPARDIHECDQRCPDAQEGLEPPGIPITSSGSLGIAAHQSGLCA